LNQGPLEPCYATATAVAAAAVAKEKPKVAYYFWLLFNQPIFRISR